MCAKCLYVYYSHRKQICANQIFNFRIIHIVQIFSTTKRKVMSSEFYCFG